MAYEHLDIGAVQGMGDRADILVICGEGKQFWHDWTMKYTCAGY